MFLVVDDFKNYISHMSGSLKPIGKKNITNQSKRNLSDAKWEFNANTGDRKVNIV